MGAYISYTPRERVTFMVHSHAFDSAEHILDNFDILRSLVFDFKSHLLEEADFVLGGARRDTAFDKSGQGLQYLLHTTELKPRKRDLVKNGSVSNSKLDRFIHGLIGSVKWWVLFSEQDECKVGPCISIARVQIVDQAQHFLSLFVATQVVARYTEVEVGKRCFEVL